MLKMFHCLRNLILLYYVGACGGWKAIPANQAMYSLRSSQTSSDTDSKEITDEDLPRDELNFIYKFGYCEPDVIRPHFFRKSVNLTLPTWQSHQAHYLYLLAKKHTINSKLQCIVLKSYVPKKFLFRKTRLPLYYCQGAVFIMMLNTINRYEIHEFYLHHKLDMPINFSFEFYHPTPVP